MRTAEFVALVLALLLVLVSFAIALLIRIARDERELYKLRKERKADKKDGTR